MRACGRLTGHDETAAARRRGVFHPWGAGRGFGPPRTVEGVDALRCDDSERLTSASHRSEYVTMVAPATPPRWYRASTDPVVGPALRLLQHNPGHPWSVAALASEVGSSPAVRARRLTRWVVPAHSRSAPPSRASEARLPAITGNVPPPGRDLARVWSARRERRGPPRLPPTDSRSRAVPGSGVLLARSPLGWLPVGTPPESAVRSLTARTSVSSVWRAERGARRGRLRLSGPVSTGRSSGQQTRYPRLRRAAGGPARPRSRRGP